MSDEPVSGDVVDEEPSPAGVEVLAPEANGTGTGVALRPEVHELATRERATLAHALAMIRPGEVTASVEAAAVVARELRAVIDNVKDAAGKPTMVARFKTWDKKARVDVWTEHVTTEGWSLLGTMLGVGSRVVHQRQVDYSHPQARNARGWESEAVAFHQATGQELAAEQGMCLRDEDTWAGKPEYAIRSMSATRARGRALRAAVGFVMRLAGYDSTPAEEVGAAFNAQDAAEEANERVDEAQGPKITEAQRTAIRERCTRLDDSRPRAELGGWWEVTDRYIERLMGVGIEGLSRHQAVQLRERMDLWLRGEKLPPEAPPPGPAPAAGPAGETATPQGVIRAAQIGGLAVDRKIPAHELDDLLRQVGTRRETMAVDFGRDDALYRRAVDHVGAWAEAMSDPPPAPSDPKDEGGEAEQGELPLDGDPGPES